MEIEELQIKLYSEIKLERIERPIIEPSEKIFGMRKSTFNPGVVYHNGKFIMLIRGSDEESGTHSNLFYAESSDGYEFEIEPNPVLVHGKDEWGSYSTKGIEDPRIVRWNEFWYVFATAWSERGTRVGIWRTKDFYSWEWIGIPHDKDDKNASILNRLIDNKVYLIDRIEPHMWISYTDDFSLKSGWKDHKVLMEKDLAYKSPLSGVEPSKIGIAGPPLETKLGWLTFFHVMHEEENEWRRAYSLGFMMLDSQDPSKIKYVHLKPVLWPEKEWEIYGNVPYVVFSCANPLVDDEIWVYYGAADTRIGLATVKLNSILSLIESKLKD